MKRRLLVDAEAARVSANRYSDGAKQLVFGPLYDEFKRLAKALTPLPDGEAIEVIPRPNDGIEGGDVYVPLVDFMTVVRQRDALIAMHSNPLAIDAAAAAWSGAAEWAPKTWRIITEKILRAAVEAVSK